MKLLRHFLGILVLLLSTAALVCCVSGMVGIWWLHQAVHQRIEAITSRVEGGLQRASAANQKAHGALDRARTSLDRMRKESARTSGVLGRRTTETMRKMVRQQVGPNVNEVAVRLATLSDAASAIASLLESAQEVQPFPTRRIDPDRLEGWTDQASQLSVTLHRLEEVVGEGEMDRGEPEVAAASSAVEASLERCQGKLESWEEELKDARDQVRSVRVQVLGWLTLAALVVSFLMGWVALGQLSLVLHVLRWW